MMIRTTCAAAIIANLSLAAHAEQLAVATWNVESFHFFSTCARIAGRHCAERTAAGSSPAVTAIALRDDFDGIDIFALTEVVGEEEAETFAIIADEDEDANYQFFVGASGVNIRIAMIFSSKRLELLESGELDFESTGGSSRKPLAARFKLKSTNEEFWAVAVHLTRGETRADGSGKGDKRNDAQARELRNWIEGQDIPVIALGDFNFDVNYQTNEERIGFTSFVTSGGPIWVRPEIDIDTNWSGNDFDEYENSILDFVFLSQNASDWQREGFGYIRDGDFPDSWRTADHRPVVAVLETDPGAPFDPDVLEFLPAFAPQPSSDLTRNAGQPGVMRTSRVAEVSEMLAAEALEEPSVEMFQSFGRTTGTTPGIPVNEVLLFEQYRQLLDSQRLVEERN